MKTTEKRTKKDKKKQKKQRKNKVFSQPCFRGSGIVCGLEVAVDEDCLIIVSGGYGVTSAGYPIELPDNSRFTHYRGYGNGQGYAWLQQTKKPVLELLTTSDETVEPLTPQTLDDMQNPIWDEKVVIAYLEPCKKKKHGKWNVRFLLMDQADVLEKLDLQDEVRKWVGGRMEEDDFVFGEDFSQEDDRPLQADIAKAWNPTTGLYKIPLFRFGFLPDEDCPPEELDIPDFPAIETFKGEAGKDIYHTYEAIVQIALEKVDAALRKVIAQYYPTLLPLSPVEEAYGQVDGLLRKWVAYTEHVRENTNTNRAKYYIQYFYDWARDLIDGYHELRDVLLKLIAECNHENSYPRHLLLGLTQWNAGKGMHSPLRHTYIQPPIFNENAYRIEKCRLYLQRQLMMIKSFYLPDYILDDQLNPYCKEKEEDDEVMVLPDFSALKITPSKNYEYPLSQRCIPFYYPLTLATSSLHHFWNYKLVRANKADHQLSYHANTTEDSYTEYSPAIRPLYYNIDGSSFFRIEGHIGMRMRSYTDEKTGKTIPGLESQLQFLIKKFNLDFDVRFIKISNNLTKEYALDYGTEPVENIRIWNPKKWVGMEHLSGVEKGGTFVVLWETTEENPGVRRAVADFSLFHRCCNQVELKNPGDDRVDEYTPSDIPKPKKPGPEPKKRPEKKKIPSKTPKKTKKPTKSPPTVKELLLKSLGGAKSNERDDLKQIKGIGPKLEKQLNDFGIYTFHQIGKMKAKDYDRIDTLLPYFKGRSKNDDWSGQAKKLSKK